MNQAADGTEAQGHTAPRILVVDDDVRLAPLMARLLREEGFTVECVGTVAQALELLRARQFDVMLCDRCLPDGNGCDLMRAALRAQAIRGIAVTGACSDEDIANSRAAGFLEHLRKPVLIEDVLAAIRRALGRAGGSH